MSLLSMPNKMIENKTTVIAVHCVKALNGYKKHIFNNSFTLSKYLKIMEPESKGLLWYIYIRLR